MVAAFILEAGLLIAVARAANRSVNVVYPSLIRKGAIEHAQRAHRGRRALQGVVLE